MIKYLIFGIFALNSIASQNDLNHSISSVKVGDTFMIGWTQNYVYKHIRFPKANFIIKKGGVANFKDLVGELVVVESVEKNDEEFTTIKIKRKDGKRFFTRYKTVSVHFQEAIKSGELARLRERN